MQLVIAGPMVEHRYFGDDHALETPGAGRDAVDKLLLNLADRREIGANGLDEFSVFLAAFFRANDIPREQPVFECVPPSGGFAVLGFGAGAFLGIAPVGGKLSSGRHERIIRT